MFAQDLASSLDLALLGCGYTFEELLTVQFMQ